VIGINSAKVSSTEVEGLGFAIPTAIALPIIEQLDNFGKVTGRAALDITAFDITAILAWRYSCPEGIYVQSVTPALEQEGLRASDIIIALNGTPVDSYSSLIKLISSTCEAGEQVTLRIYRYQSISQQFKEMDAVVTLSEAQ